MRDSSFTNLEGQKFCNLWDSQTGLALLPCLYTLQNRRAMQVGLLLIKGNMALILFVPGQQMLHLLCGG